ncbi:MAG TPA: hypothetical protein VK674_00085 [Candidatus Limnocylindria bacterium]|nr:hypothetical protein [Candidatus Limnocylindria bacterium]
MKGASLRNEWSGNLFASDLLAVRDCVEGTFEHLPMPGDAVATVFYAVDGSMKQDPGLRARAYPDTFGGQDGLKNLKNLDDLGVRRWELQGKSGSGLKVKHRTIDNITPYVWQNGLRIVPYALRLARREHYYLGDDEHSDFATTAADHQYTYRTDRTDELNAARRLTLEASRRLYALAADHSLRHVGELAPRLEIKSPVSSEIGRVLAATALDEISYPVPYLPYEPILTDMIKQRITHDTAREDTGVEPAVYTVPPESSLAVLDQVSEWVADHPKLQPLVPDTPYVAHLSRLHFYQGGETDEKVGVVENTSGYFLAPVTAPSLIGHLLLSRPIEALGFKFEAPTCPEYSYENNYYLVKEHAFYIEVGDAAGTCLRVTYSDCQSQTGDVQKFLDVSFAGTRNAEPDTALASAAVEQYGQQMKAWLRPEKVALKA